MAWSAAVINMKDIPGFVLLMKVHTRRVLTGVEEAVWSAPRVSL